MTWLGLALGALVGLSLGLLGGGGSILTVPIFVYVIGIEPKQAIAMSLAVVGTTSLFGALEHRRARNVDVRVALVFGAVAMAGAYLGARLAVFVSGTFQLLLFAVVMLAAAWFMFRGPPPAVRSAAAARPAGGRIRFLSIAAQAIGVGVLTGLVGVGGGFLIVPALVLLGGLPMKRAIGTSLLVIAMNSAAGFAGYLGRVPIRWGFMAAFAVVAVGGIVAGARLVRLVPQDALRRAFAAFLVLMGLFILYQNRGGLLSSAGDPPPEAPPAHAATTRAPPLPVRPGAGGDPVALRGPSVGNPGSSG